MFDVIQNFVNAENVSIAHLLYEQRLAEQSPISSRPDIGGQAFMVTDPNPAISFNDLYTLLALLAKTPVNFTRVAPGPLFVLAHFIELYSIIQFRYLPWLPKVTGDLAQMQPALFSISTVHTICDDSRARKAPEEGGLGYNPPISTLDGMCKEVLEWNSRVEKKEEGLVENTSPVSVSKEGVDVNIAVPPKKF